MNDPEQIPTLLRALYGRPKPRLLCRIGWHKPMNAAIVDHDKVRRKVYGCMNLTVCKHCLKPLDD